MGAAQELARPRFRRQHRLQHALPWTLPDFSALDLWAITAPSLRLDRDADQRRLANTVAAADGSISSVEDDEIRRIANELCLPHADFISARRGFREHLAVLKTR